MPIVHERISIPNLNTEKEYWFSDAAGDEIDSQYITLSTKGSNIFNISNLPKGLILFYTSNAEVKKFYHYPKAVWKKPFAIVEIFPRELLKQFSEKGKVDYAFNFKNRQTIWKYFLVSPVYQNFKNLSITNKRKEQIFNSPQNQFINNNTEALVFESKSKIPLAEHSGENFQLIEDYASGSGKMKLVIKDLPKASPTQLHRDEPNTDAIYSHIYI